jgi:hypothetical protein
MYSLQHVTTFFVPLHSFLPPSPHLLVFLRGFKGLPHEMDLTCDDMFWLILGLKRGRGQFFKLF